MRFHECEELLARLLLQKDDFAVSGRSVKLKHLLGQVDADD